MRRIRKRYYITLRVEGSTLTKNAERSGLGKTSIGEVLNRASIVIVLVLLCAIMSILSPNFYGITNIINILQQISINTVVAIGMTFVIMSGGIDLSVGSIVALVGLVYAVLMKKAGVSPYLALPIGLALGALIGLVNGLFISFVNLPPFIATLGSMSIVRGCAYTITDGQSVYQLPEAFLKITNRIGNWLPVPIILMTVLILVSAYVLHYTKFGRHVYAIGGNESAAKLSGINVRFNKVMVYVISGFTSAIAAYLLTARLDSGVPTAAEGYETEAIAAVVIGGTSMSGGEGNMFGTFIGALIIGIIGNGMNLLFIPNGPQRIVKGAIILIAVSLDSIKNIRMRKVG